MNKKFIFGNKMIKMAFDLHTWVAACVCGAKACVRKHVSAYTARFSET